MNKQLKWAPIETAPHDRPVDLWIVGNCSDVDFYSSTAVKVKGKPLRHGRAPCFRFEHHPPNQPNWYPLGGLGYPLSHEVVATHWMDVPGPPDTEYDLE